MSKNKKHKTQFTNLENSATNYDDVEPEEVYQTKATGTRIDPENDETLSPSEQALSQIRSSVASVAGSASQSSELDWRTLSRDGQMDTAAKVYSQELQGLKKGDVLGRKYQLIEPAGSGAMGVVWKAKDTISGIFVALKFVPLDIQSHSKRLEEMRSVFRLMQRFTHSNICPMMGLEQDDTYGYFQVMNWLDGVTLEQYRSEQPGKKLPPEEVPKLLEGIAAGLDFAHKNGVIHRDVKPSNIFLWMDNKHHLQRVQLIDFGIAAEFPCRLTSGTPAYMPLEQHIGEEQDAQTDQFSLAVVAYELYSGQRPFQGQNTAQLIADISRSAPASIPGLPDYTNVALRKALSFVRKARYTTCAEFVQALRVASATVNLPTFKMDQLPGMISWDSSKIPQTAPIVIEDLTLPPVPEKIYRLSFEIDQLEKTIQQFEAGTHPTLQQANQAIQNAEAVYKQAETTFQTVDQQRLESWKPLPAEVQKQLWKKIVANPNLDFAVIRELCPVDVSYVAFGQMLQEGRRAQFVRAEYLRVKAKYNELRNQIVQQCDEALKELKKQQLFNEEKKVKRDGLIIDLRRQVLLEVLGKCVGFSDVNAPFPYERLFSLIPALLRYEFGWQEKPLFDEAEKLWKNDRPCVVMKQRKAAEKARQAAEKARQIAEEARQAAEKKQVRQRKIRYAVVVFCLLLTLLFASSWFQKDPLMVAIIVSGVLMVITFWMISKSTTAKTKSSVLSQSNQTNTTLEVEQLLSSDSNSPTTANTAFKVAKIPAAPVAIIHQAGECMTKTVNGVKYAFRWCPAGKFMMGSDGNQHEVTLTKGFWILETEVTQRMWQSVMGNNPSYFKGDDLPVEQVSWDDCQAFCEKLTSKIGMKITLPTEAQWEYACRAGTTTPFSFGSVLNGEQANCNGTKPYGTDMEGPNLAKTTSVRSYAPNNWGLYDMHGNVREWCQDWYGIYPTGSVEDPTGPDSGSNRVRRGGGWGSRAQSCRSAFRDRYSADYRSDFLGFRAVGCPSR